MSKCPPGTSYGKAESDGVIEGTYTRFLGYESLTPEAGTGDDELLLWAKVCTTDKVTWVGGEFHDGETITKSSGGLITKDDKVRCDLSETEIKTAWDEIKKSPANPHEFLFDPLDWIRFELNSLLSRSVHWWLEVSDPFEPEGDFSKGQANTFDIQDELAKNTLFLVGVIAVVSLLFVAGRMALQRNAQPARDMVRGMITLIVVAASAFTLIQVLLRASDRFANYFIVAVLKDENSARPLSDRCSILDARIDDIPARFEHMNFFLFLLCAIFMLTASVVLYMYMIARVFVITLLAGLMPLAAAGTATQGGKQWFAKHVTYLFAFILVKPAATVVFVVGLRMSSGVTKASSDLYQLNAALFLFMGTVLLPAMTRLAFPFVSQAAQGDKGAAALAAAPLAVGAKVVKGGVDFLRK